jgi:TP901 family phage tail tape measure protein|nr:MAG TPA: minor tail protein [Caudoviricetes sp.]
MGTNDFQIGLVGKLDANQSKQQLNSDIDALKKQLNTVEVQAQLGKDVVSKLTQQLNATQFTINNVKVDQTAINNMISQFNTAFSKVNINLGNINTNGATQSAQKTGQQIGNQLGNSINQSLQANLNHVKQDIQNIFSSFSVQKLNNADIFKNFNLNRAKIDPSVTKDVQSLTAEINKLAREALKTNSDSAWEGITQKISNLSDVLNKFGTTRDLSGFKEQMDLLDYFQGKKIFVGDKAEAIQNTGMSIRELNNQFRNLGVTFTTVENGSTKLDEIWSELFNIKPSFQGIDSFGGQINAVVNELKIAKEAMYGDSNLMPAQRTGATTTYLNAWLEMLEKLSQRIEILKTEQANLQNQMAQASNNATNAVVANQQKQQQAYQQTGSVIQAVTSNTSVIGNMPKEASDIGDAKNQLSQLLQNEKAVIATTQHFDNDGMMRTFTLNVKRATGEVESLNYAFRQVTDNNGNVTDTYFENTSSHLNDSGAIKQIDAIEEAFSDYTTEIAKFKSTNAEILSGLDTPLKDFETKLAGLKTGASTVNEVKSAFNSLNTEAAKITQNFSKQLSPIDRAVSKIANGEETIKGLHAELKGLDNTPKDLSKELNQCAKALQKVKDIEANEGRTENWSKAYKQWAESIDTVTSKIKTLKKEQSNVASTQVFNTSDLKANNIAYMSKVHNTIEKQMVEINRLANANGWSDVKVTGVEEASGKIQKLTLTVRDAEGALKQFNMQREKIQGNGKTQAGLVQTGDVKVLETAVQYAEKLKSIESSMGQFGNTTTSIANLENSFTKLGLSTDEVNSKMEAVRTEYATLQNMMSNGASGNEIVNQFEKVNSVLQETQNSLKQTKIEADNLSSIKSIKEAIDIGDYDAKVARLENSFTKLGLSTDEVNSKMSAVKKALNELNSVSDDQLVEKEKTFNLELKKSQNEVAQLKTQLDQIYNPNKQLRLSNNIQEWLQKNTKAARDAKEQLEKYYQELNSGEIPINRLNQISDEFEKIKITQRGLGKLGKNLKDQIAQAVTSFSQWISISSAVMLSVGKFKDAISELKELDDILTEISKTSNLTSSQLKELGNSAFDSASEYGKSASDYLTGVQEMYRAGFENASEMSELSILAQSAGDMTAEMSNDYLIATSAAYDLKGNVKDLNDVLDGQNYITNNAAVSMSDMASATSEAASIASQYGVKINELSSLIAVATAKTRESGSETGNALKSLFINLQDTTSDPIRKAFEAVGISMTKMVNGAEKLKTPIELLKELSKAFNELPEGDTRRANILSDIGGKWHANTLSAILSDWSSFEKMESLYSQGSGSALQEAEKSANNLSGSLEKLSNDWTSFVQNIVNSDGLKTGVNLLDGLLKVVTSLSDGLNSLGSFGTIGTLVGLVQSITGHGENVLRPSF